MRVDRPARDGRMIDERYISHARARHQAFEDARENRFVEWIEEVDDEIAAREDERRRIATHQSHVATPERRAIEGFEIIAGDRMERGRNLDADDLPERVSGGEQNGATHSRAYIDERRVFPRERHEFEQRIEIADRGRLVVRRMHDARSDGFGIEVAEKEQRLGRDVSLGIEALSGAPTGNADR